MQKNYFENLPSWSRGIISIVGVGAVAFIGYQIYTTIKNNRDLAKSLEAQKLADKELSDLKKNGVVPTKTASQFEVFSAKINEAVNDCGTDEQAIYTVFNSLNNRADLLSLISAFGIRYYRPCAATDPISYTRWMFNNNSFGGDLSTLLAYDLDSSEIAKINNILKSKNIDFTF
jgi:hypothetical protein